MNAAAKYLQGLKISDVMTRDVVTISYHATMAEAAQLMVKQGVSGVPVVNEFGVCVGVLSQADFAKRDRNEHSSLEGDEYLLSRSDGLHCLQIEFVADDSVQSHMSQAPQSISATLSLLDAAEYLLGSHIHRLVVVDEGARPIGVVSTMDILQAIVSEQMTQDEPKAYRQGQI